MDTKKIRLLSIIFLPALVLLSCSTQAVAALGDGFDYHGILIKPYFEVKESYDSNVFLDENDAKDDLVTTIKSGADIEMPWGRDIVFMGGYGVDANLYVDHTDQDNVNHTVMSALDWTATNFEVIVKDVYRYFSDRAGTENTDRVLQQTNTFSADLLTELDQLAFDIGYDYVIRDYLSNDHVIAGITYDKAEDRSEHTLRGEMSYRFLPKTSLLVECDTGLIMYRRGYNADSHFVQGLLGLRGEFLKNSTIDLKGGVRWQEYDPDVSNTYAGILAEGVVTKPLGQKDAVMLRVQHSVHESTYQDVSYYILDYVGLGYSHQFNDKLSGSLGGAYQQNRYPKKSLEAGGQTAKRWDNLYSAECGLKYDIKKWISAEATYKFVQRESKFSVYDYIDHVASAGILMKF